jgi:tetratricopeptide (TPR) repeat protein
MVRALTALACALLLVGGGCQKVSARRKIQEGNKFYYDGKFIQATAAYEEGVRLDPSLDVGWYNLALSHLAQFSAGKQGDENAAHAKRAIEAFRKYLELNPSDKDAQNFLLQTYIDSGEIELAVAHFEKLIEEGLKTGDKASVRNAASQIAKIYSDAGDKDKAIEWHRKRALAEWNDSDGKFDAWYRIGDLEYKKIKGRTAIRGAERVKIADTAIAAIQKAIELKPESKDAHVMQNVLYHQRAQGQGLSYARLVDVASADVGKQKVAEIKKKLEEEQKKAGIAPADPTKKEQPKQ